MEIEVPILWVDDRADYAESVADKLKSWLDGQGLELKPIIRTSTSTVLDDIKNNDLELIIIDYMMPDENGDVLIERIRKSGCYQDILFYTGDNLKLKEMLGKRFDGVFYVHKDYTNAKIQELIKLKLWRLSDPATVRGWIVADAIELEFMVTELLEHCFSPKNGFTFAERFLYSPNSPIDFGRKANILNGILGDLISWHRIQIPKNDDLIKKLSNCKDIFDKFAPEIVETRNAVAHQRIEHTDTGKIIKKKTKAADKIAFDDVTLIKIRNDLRKHYKNLEVLKRLL